MTFSPTSDSDCPAVLQPHQASRHPALTPTGGPRLSPTDYKIEKLRCPVLMTLSDGEQLRGDIFVRTVSRFRPEPQSAAEFLNEDDAYFALVSPNGMGLMVSKDSVVRVETDLPSDDDDSVALPRPGLDIELTLVGGGVCHGTVFVDTPTERGRLIDYLNSYAGRFLVIYDTTKVTLLNRRAVAHVRELR